MSDKVYTQDEVSATCANVYNEGLKTQMHRIEKLVREHLGQAIELPADYFKSDLEKAMHGITLQFIDAIKREALGIKGFSSIYLK